MTLGGFQDVVSIAWSVGIDSSAYFVVGSRDKSVRTWKVRKDEDSCIQVCLHWRSSSDTLVL